MTGTWEHDMTMSITSGATDGPICIVGRRLSMGLVQLDVLDIAEYKLEARIILSSSYQFARVPLVYISIGFAPHTIRAWSEAHRC